MRKTYLIRKFHPYIRGSKLAISLYISFDYELYLAHYVKKIRRSYRNLFIFIKYRLIVTSILLYNTIHTQQLQSRVLVPRVSVVLISYRKMRIGAIIKIKIKHLYS